MRPQADILISSVPRKAHNRGAYGKMHRITILFSTERYVHDHPMLKELEARLIKYHDEINTYEFIIDNCVQIFVRGDRLPFMKQIGD